MFAGLSCISNVLCAFRQNVFPTDGNHLNAILGGSNEDNPFLHLVPIYECFHMFRTICHNICEAIEFGNAWKSKCEMLEQFSRESCMSRRISREFVAMGTNEVAFEVDDTKLSNSLNMNHSFDHNMRSYHHGIGKNRNVLFFLSKVPKQS